MTVISVSLAAGPRDDLVIGNLLALQGRLVSCADACVSRDRLLLLETDPLNPGAVADQLHTLVLHEMRRILPL